MFFFSGTGIFKMWVDILLHREIKHLSIYSMEDVFLASLTLAFAHLYFIF
jgi:hypothetical protein